MDDNQMKELVREIISEILSAQEEINRYKEECAGKMAVASEAIAAKDKEIEELNAVISSIKSELEACKNEKNELNATNEDMKTELNSLNETVVKLQEKEKINELNAAIADFSEDEKSYAKAEIDAFNENPVNSEINSVVNAILVGIGKKAKEQATILSEKNASKLDTEDIFSEVGVTFNLEEDSSIF